MEVNIEQVYQENRDHLYNYVYRLCNDHHQAQDVAQHSFIKLMNDPRSGDIKNIKSYLFTIARNHLYDTWKKKTETLFDEAGIEPADQESTSALSDELSEQELQQAVGTCISRLSDKFRELMLLRYMEDLSIREIAGITGLTESDIKVSLLRARKQFDHGLTQHMYLKVASSRQQCDEMAAMLAPYIHQDIPEAKLPSFTRHIDHCELCAEDAKEMKRKRKLFALIPLVGAPLSLDSAFNDALAQGTTPAASTGTNKAGLIKIAAGVGAVAIITGGVLLMSGKDHSGNSVVPQNPVPPQTVNRTNTSPLNTPVTNNNNGSIPITATLRLTQGSSPTKAYWSIYQMDHQHVGKEQYIGGSHSTKLQQKLSPGQYKIVGRVGETEVSRLVQMEKDKPVALELIAGAGKLSITTPLPDKIKLHASQMMYVIYKSRQDLDNGKTVAVKSLYKPATLFTLAAGSYVVKVSYHGFGKLESIRDINVIAGKTTDISIPLDIGMFQPVAVLSGKNLAHIRNIDWEIAQGPKTKIKNRRNIQNSSQVPMAPGEYVFTTLLGNIKQQSRTIIRPGQLTPHKVVLKGGIIKAAVWADKNQTTRNDRVRIDIYDYQKRRNQKKNTYLPKEASIRNDLKTDTILAEGKYIMEIRNNIRHTLLATQHFTLNDGDIKNINLVIPD